MENAQKKIDELVKSKDVLLFMKGSPEQPRCGFSMTVSKILKDLKIKFYSINVLEDEEIRVGIKQYSNWPTIPQLYIKGNFIGGCDIVKEMYQKGELQKILKITT